MWGLTYSWGSHTKGKVTSQGLDTDILQTVNTVLSHSELTHNDSEHTGNNDDTSGYLRTFYTNLLQYIKNCYPTKHEKSLFECQVIYLRGH